MKDAKPNLALPNGLSNTRAQPKTTKEPELKSSGRINNTAKQMKNKRS